MTTAALPRPQLRWSVTVSTIILHVLALLALLPSNFSWTAVGVAVGLHAITQGLGISLGFHRLASHRSLRVPLWLEHVFILLGTLAFQGGVYGWVGYHRLHHMHTDQELDPHSASKGFWWSHILWMVYPYAKFFDYDQYSRYAPELARDPVYQWLNRYYLLLQIPLGLVLYGLGGWSFVMYGIFLRAVLLWHSTWFINSVTHLWGYRTFSTHDNSRNLWWAAILTYGEGWHNNHHAYPQVARAGWHWWEIDVTWWAIWLLQTLGLAQKVVEIPAHVKLQIK